MARPLLAWPAWTLRGRTPGRDAETRGTRASWEEGRAEPPEPRSRPLAAWRRRPPGASCRPPAPALEPSLGRGRGRGLGQGQDGRPTPSVAPPGCRLQAVSRRDLSPVGATPETGWGCTLQEEFEDAPPPKLHLQIIVVQVGIETAVCLPSGCLRDHLTYINYSHFTGELG